MSSGEVMVALGTRPELIKLAGIIDALGASARVVHTGQHYDAEMWDNVLADFPGISVHHRIMVGGRSRGEQIGSATNEISRYLDTNPCRVVVVQGDTNSTLAGALAATASRIPLVHVEAGLRSKDRSMPEEVNRILVDAVSDLCCAPVEANAQTLRREGVDDDRILVTGNTLIDAQQWIGPQPGDTQAVLDHLGFAPSDPYVLCTVHRAGLVDDRESLVPILEALGSLAQRVRVITPLHPRTARKVAEFGLGHLLAKLSVVAPVTAAQFMALEMGASLIVSDSGGVQEEACLFRRPLVVLRNSTERPELLDGWCRLLGNQDPHDALLQAWQDALPWALELQTRSLPYPARPACGVIVDEIHRRWLG